MTELARWITDLDRSAFLALNHWLKCAALDRVMPAASDLGLGHVQVLAVLAAAVVLGARQGVIHRSGVWRGARQALYSARAWVGPLLVAIVLSGLSASAAKQFVPRARPWWYYENQHQAGRDRDVWVYTVRGEYPLKVYGFPSGHTATSVAIAMAATLALGWRAGRRGLLVGLWLLAAAVAVSRMYLASHWPLDVLGGVVFGIAGAWAAMAVCRAWAGRSAVAPAPGARPDAAPASGPPDPVVAGAAGGGECV